MRETSTKGEKRKVKKIMKIEGLKMTGSNLARRLDCSDFNSEIYLIHLANL